MGLVRALSFSRVSQTQQHLLNELEAAQSQTQSLVEDSNRAIATIQEGIHIQANADYLKLFGLQSEDEIIGLPLLDLLQPSDLNDFKTRFKKISQGQVDLGRVEIHSLNPRVAASNPLKLEFLPSSAEEDALQITIDTQAQAGNTEKPAGKPSTFQLLKREITKQSAPVNAIVTFSLSSYEPEVLQSEWTTFSGYFKAVKEFLKEQTHVPLFKLEYDVLVGLFQADSKAILESKLIGLNALSKPQLVTVGQNSFPLNLRMGYVVLEQGLNDEAHCNELIARAFSTSLPQAEVAPEFVLDIPASLSNQPSLEMPQIDFSVAETPIESPTVAAISPAVSSIPAATPHILKALSECLDRGEIHLKYQQLYDKEDTRLYTYEVTSGFIYENKWQDISTLLELHEDDELSIKLDRWILVEASKQLHNFITQYPDATLIVNLNRAVLFKDRSFPEFISKLITIIRSKVRHPLILQFSEEDILLNQQDAQKYLRVLHEHGALIALRDFGQSMYSPNLLRELEIDGVSLHSSLTQMLNNETGVEQLQEKITSYNDIKPLNILVRELNDMTLFANAWNVDARFIQGDYFQKKLDHLIDVQEH